MRSSSTFPSAAPIYAIGVTVPDYPREVLRSAHFRVRVGGQEAFVWQTDLAAFVCVEFSGSVEVEVECTGPAFGSDAFPLPMIRPLSRGLKAVQTHNGVRFTLPRPIDVSVDFGFSAPSLYIYASAPDADIPAKGAPGVHYFAAGQVHTVGRLELRSGEQVYIEAGAVVRGCIRAIDTQGISIRGRGILDGSFYTRGVDETRSIVIENSQDALIEDIVMIEPSLWMLVLADSCRVTVRGLRQLGQCVSSDGIDIVGSRDVAIEDCFLRNNDDCIAIKAGGFWTAEPP